MRHDPGTDALRDYLTGLTRAGEIPGAVWRVSRAGAVLATGSVGFATLEPDRVPVAETTPFDLASLTKPLATAILALDLEREGRLSIDSGAVRWLPELAGGPYECVTLLDLGTHEAGLPAWRPVYLSASTADEYVREIARTPPAGPRGATLYSDLGFVLLGAALERASGAPLDALFRTRIAEPLRLPRMGFARPGTNEFADAAATECGNEYEKGMAGAAAEGHPFRTRMLRGEVHDGNAAALSGVAGHAGLFGTAAEVERIAAEVLMPRATAWAGYRRDALLAAGRGKHGRTFGWVLAKDSNAARGVLPDDAPGHTGFTGTSVWIEPARGTTYVLLTNRVHPAVRATDFQAIRREFHRRAAVLARHDVPA